MEAVRAIETRWTLGSPHVPLVAGLLPRPADIAPRDSAGTKDPFRPPDRRVWGFESAGGLDSYAHGLAC
jgi:hypothetical protein